MLYFRYALWIMCEDLGIRVHHVAWRLDLGIVSERCHGVGFRECLNPTPFHESLNPTPYTLHPDSSLKPYALL